METTDRFHGGHFAASDDTGYAVDISGYRRRKKEKNDANVDANDVTIFVAVERR